MSKHFNTSNIFLPLALLASAFVLHAQAPAQFGAASIKPAASALPGEGSSRSRIDFTPTGLTMRNVNLSECVQWAWNAKFFQVSVPDSLNNERYDISAKADAVTPLATLRLMLQNLLARRFRMTLQREMKAAPVYLLVAAKGGPKLPRADDNSSLTSSVDSTPQIRNGDFIFANVSMTSFAEKLSDLRGIERPVLDRTGIEGAFDITVKSAAAAIMQADGPSLFTLLQEQLGLRLTPSREPIEMFTVTSATKPSEN